MNAEKLAEQNAHIPTSEIEQDILDTEREIAQMEEEAAHLATTPSHSRDYRWNCIRAEARRSGISERKEFVKILKAILEFRSAIQGGTREEQH